MEFVLKADGKVSVTVEEACDTVTTSLGVDPTAC
jgi:hypothetical protein